MPNYLLPSPLPVIPELASSEVVYAKDQPEYLPLRTLVSKDRKRRVLSRWTLMPEQRKAIAEGADIFLELMTFGSPLQPIRLMITDNPTIDLAGEGYGPKCPMDEPATTSVKLSE
jgi:hypothetical protein